MFNKSHKIDQLLGGALFALSFINPRQPFILFFLIIFLYGIKKISAKKIILYSMMMIVFLGPIFYAIFYKMAKIILMNLYSLITSTKIDAILIPNNLFRKNLTII